MPPSVELPLVVVKPVPAVTFVTVPVFVVYPLGLVALYGVNPRAVVISELVKEAHDIEPSVEPAFKNFPLLVVLVAGTCKLPSPVG